MNFKTLKIILPLILISISIGIRLHADTAENYFNSAVAKFNIQDYRGAIQYLNKSIELNPNYAEAYHYRGAAKVMLQNYTGVMQIENKLTIQL